VQIENHYSRHLKFRPLEDREIVHLQKRVLREFVECGFTAWPGGVDGTVLSPGYEARRQNLLHGCPHQAARSISTHQQIVLYLQILSYYDEPC
jgi:hypothetical protein